MLKVNSTKPTFVVPYVENGETVATFNCSPLSATEVKELVKKHTKITWETPKRGAIPQRHEEFDPFGMTCDKIDRVIISWTGVTDENENPLPCDRSHKLMLFEFNADVINNVLEKLEEMQRHEDEHKEEERKN